MLLSRLFQYLPEADLKELASLDIQGLHYDSRKAGPKDLFVALRGYKNDGHAYIPDVLSKGAIVVAETGAYPPAPHVILVQNTRRALALLSKAYFGSPDRELTVLGVTGTNGKTTSTFMLKSILEAQGIKTGLIGTIFYSYGDKLEPATHTTPESYETYRMMREIRNNGGEALVMEISSHALFLDRVYGLDLDVAIFTNLTQDHLDFHESLDAYLKAKLLIFDLLQNSHKSKKLALLNQDAQSFNEIKAYVAERGLDYQTYGIHSPAHWQGFSLAMNIVHNIFEVKAGELTLEIDTPMLGEFNIYNALGALGAAFFLGISPQTISRALSGVHVPGRFQTISNFLGFAVLIDYAHTPDALENIIRAGQALKPLNIITVFGCGGDRDKGKRPLMGDVARRLSSYTILTSDNPRSEDPAGILSEIEAAFNGSDAYESEIDRERAIKKAIDMADAGDLVIIAGKGHEDYQIFKDKTIHFSDKEMAEKYLRERESALSYKK